MSTGTAPPPTRRRVSSVRQWRTASPKLEAKFAATRADPESIAYLETIRTTPLMRDLLDRKLALEWAATEVVYDDPAKTLDTEDRKDVLLFPELMRKMGRPEKQLDIVSPYFVPGDGGTELLAAVAKRGVTVRILTNSLAASDEKSVHSGYAKRRRELLQAGVRLYEIKPTATKEESESDRPIRIRLVLRPACQDARGRQPSGSSSARSISTSARRTSTPKWAWCSAIRCSRRV